MSVTIDTSRVWTYADLLEFPEDHTRREVIGGVLVVTPTPSLRHQDAVLRLAAALLHHADERGGRAIVAPVDVHFGATDVVEPDVVYVRNDHLDRLEERRVVGPPDLVAEVSSPSTRRIDQLRKRRLYEHGRVAEYWFVDLDADRIECYRLEEHGYGEPSFFLRGDRAESSQASGFSIPVDDVLGEPPPDG